MPWRLRKAPKNKWGNDAYWVVDDTGKHYSKDPMPKKQARQQQKALYANESKMKGGAEAVAAIPTFEEYLASRGIPVGSYGSEQIGPNAWRAVVSPSDKIVFDEAKFKDLMKGMLSRAAFEAKPRRQTYEQYAADFERVQRSRSTRNLGVERRAEMDKKLLDITNKAHADYIAQYPEAEEIKCNIGADGERIGVPERTTMGECKRRHIAYDKKKAREGPLGAITGALTDIADVAVNFLPGVGKVAGEVYKAFAPPTSQYYGQGKTLRGGILDEDIPPLVEAMKEAYDEEDDVMDGLEEAVGIMDTVLTQLGENDVARNRVLSAFLTTAIAAATTKDERAELLAARRDFDRDMSRRAYREKVKRLLPHKRAVALPPRRAAAAAAAPAAEPEPEPEPEFIPTPTANAERALAKRSPPASAVAPPRPPRKGKGKPTPLRKYAMTMSFLHPMAKAAVDMKKWLAKNPPSHPDYEATQSAVRDLDHYLTKYYERYAKAEAAAAGEFVGKGKPKGKIMMSRADFKREHEHLIKLLRKSSDPAILAEAAAQEKEMKAMLGSGLFSNIVSGFKKVVGRVADVFKGVRRDYPPDVRQTLAVIGNQPIVEMTIRRDPIRSMLNTAFNLITLGKWNEVRAKYAYDKLFHLGVEITLADGRKYVAEKNQTLNIAPANPTDAQTERMPVSLPARTITVNEMLRNTQEKQGDKYFLYDAFTNNCQDWISDLLKANGLATAENLAFVKQPLENVLSELPSYTSGVARVATDLGALADVALKGRGRARPHAAFAKQLREVGIKPMDYIAAVRKLAADTGYDPADVSFADTAEHKIAIKRPDGGITRAGRVGYGDFIIWSYLEAHKKAPAGTADKKRATFRKSHNAIKGAWKADKFSPNNIALNLLW